METLHDQFSVEFVWVFFFSFFFFFFFSKISLFLSGAVEARSSQLGLSAPFSLVGMRHLRHFRPLDFFGLYHSSPLTVETSIS